MNYEKKYKEALERAKEYHDNGGAPLILEVIFPELKESEEEKIKRELRNDLILYVPTPERYIDWLEKQGHVNNPHWISVEDELPKDYEPVLAAFANHFARVCFHCGKTWYLNKPLAAEEMEGVTNWMPLPQPPAVLSSLERAGKKWKGGKE